MHEAEGLNFKVGVPAENDDRPKKVMPRAGFRYNNPNLNDIYSFIGGLPITEKDKEYLVGVAKSKPHGALFNFRKNYMHYLTKEGRR